MTDNPQNKVNLVERKEPTMITEVVFDNDEKITRYYRDPSYAQELKNNLENVEWDGQKAVLSLIFSDGSVFEILYTAFNGIRMRVLDRKNNYFKVLDNTMTHINGWNRK